MMELKGKKVLVVGLGKSGLAAALFLRRKGAQVTVSDVRSAEALAKEIPALLEEGIMVEAGGHGLLTFRRQDLIVVSPGVPLDTPELVQVKSFGLPVIGELELAARFLKGRMLAITGSNGKTTTTALLGEILKNAGLPTLVGGNIGVPVVGLIDESTDETWSVLEVSSFQLESTVEFHPNIAVILNITPDHLDRHGSFENYALAKERIFAAQDEHDLPGAERRQCARRRSRSPLDGQGLLVFRRACGGAGRLAGGRDTWSIGRRRMRRLRGDAARRNPAQGRAQRGECAGRGGGSAGWPALPAEAIRQRRREVSRRSSTGWSTWPPINGVDFYNDSKATNVDATAKAIAAFDSGIHLILGGKDKGSDYTLLAQLLRERVRAVYTIGAAAAKIESQLRGVVSIESCETLDNAVIAAASAARPGEVVLLAPACSSFDQFESYEHRGRVFKELVSRTARVEGMAKRVGVDKWMFFTTLLLVVVGLVMVFSASAVVAQERYHSAFADLSANRLAGRWPAWWSCWSSCTSTTASTSRRASSIPPCASPRCCWCWSSLFPAPTTPIAGFALAGTSPSSPLRSPSRCWSCFWPGFCIPGWIRCGT